MSEEMVERKTEGKGRMAKASLEVRLLSVACLCFIVAQSVVTDHAWNSAFLIAALLAVIAVLFIALRTLRAWRYGTREGGRSEATVDVLREKMSVEVRLLSVACLFFMTANWMVEEHPLDHGFGTIAAAFRIAALLAFIAGQWIGFRTRKA